MPTLQDNMATINQCKVYKGGENEDISIDRKAIDDMISLVKLIDKSKIIQPEIFPWCGGRGIQAQWNINNYHIEIDSSEKGGVTMLIVKRKDYGNSVSCEFKNIQEAFKLLYMILNLIKENNYE